MNRSVLLFFSTGALILTAAAAFALARPGSQAATAAQGQKSDAAPAGNAENGKRIYKSYGCYQCHGYDGQGGQGSGPRIGPPATQMKAFSAYIKKPSGQMPPYTAKVVSEADVADIYAFLLTVPKPPAAKSIPLLNE